MFTRLRLKMVIYYFGLFVKELTLIISKTSLDEVIKHALETYPEECCGLLVGKKEGEKKVVIKVVRSKNVYVGDRSKRYMIDALDIYNVEKDAEKHGLMLIGVYHSHPNYLAKPSAYDAEAAWSSISYLIVSIRDKRFDEVTAWVFDKKNEEFLKEDIIVV